jgi:hypothetical protein
LGTATVGFMGPADTRIKSSVHLHSRIGAIFWTDSWSFTRKPEMCNSKTCIPHNELLRQSLSSTAVDYLSPPSRNGLCFPLTSISRIMSTGSKMDSVDSNIGASLSNPRTSDASFPDQSTDPVALEKGKSPLSKDRLEEAVAKFPTLLRKMIGDICRELSPQESFEFRLRTRFDYRDVPLGTNPPSHVEQGLAYHVADADWLSPDGEEIRKVIEDDDRYRVDLGSLEKDHGTTLIFMPEEPLPHMLNEKDDASSPADPNGPSDPRLLEKANALVEKTRQTQLDYTKDFYKKLGEICLLLSPRDSFTVRLKSRSVFEEGARIYQYELCVDEEEEIMCFGGKNTDMFDIFDSNCFGDEEFKQFLESDDRYRVEYIVSEMCKETRADGGKGTIAFVIKSDEIDDEDDNDTFTNESNGGNENEDTDEEEDDDNVIDDD